jgi:hypothetical protein
MVGSMRLLHRPPDALAAIALMLAYSRPTAEPSRQVIAEVLTRPMSVTELTVAVIEAGYRSSITLFLWPMAACT